MRLVSVVTSVDRANLEILDEPVQVFH